MSLAVVVIALVLLAAGFGGLDAAIVVATIVVAVLSAIFIRRDSAVAPEHELVPVFMPLEFVAETTTDSAALTPPAPVVEIVPPRDIPERTVPRPIALPRPADLLWRFAALATALLFAWILLPGLRANPVGFFCDEAEIGLEAYRLVHERLSEFPVFYQHFGYKHLGALPLYSTAPFVTLFGLDETGVRLASVFWSVAGALVLMLLVRKLNWRYGEIGVVAFMATPIFIHFARVQFGQAISFFFVSLGLLLYAMGRDRSRWFLAALAGAAIAISSYGSAAYYIAAPVILGSLVLGEIVTRRLNWRGYRNSAVLVLGALFAWSPAIARLVNDPAFLRRFNDRQESTAPVFSLERLDVIASNYPKYWDVDFLFRVGESGSFGSFLTRHSVPGSGELTWLVVPLIVLGLVATVRTNDPATRVFGVAAAATLILFPMPDAFLSLENNAPYALSVWSTLVCVPVLAALGVHALATHPHVQGLKFAQLVPVAILALALLGAYRFNTGPYERYPLVSADYWGWQYGPRVAIDEFKARRDEYDGFVLDGQFNEAFIFLDFYLHDDPELRARTRINEITRTDSTRRTLWAIRIENYNAWVETGQPGRRIIQIVDEIRYPNGQIAMVLLEIDAANDDGRLEVPR